MKDYNTPIIDGIHEVINRSSLDDPLKKSLHKKLSRKNYADVVQALIDNNVTSTKFKKVGKKFVDYYESSKKEGRKNLGLLSSGLSIILENDPKQYDSLRVKFRDDLSTIIDSYVGNEDLKDAIKPFVSLDKYLGVVFGHKSGDILGGAVEFMTPDQIRSKHGYLKDVVGGGPHRLEVGEDTDDFQQFKILLSSFVEKKRFDAPYVLQKLIDWKNSKPKDIGRLTKDVLGQIEQLKTINNWYNVSQKYWQKNFESADGNGSLMRTAPVALFHYKNSEGLYHDSVQSSEITHYSPLCRVSCYIFNYAVTELMRNGEVDVQKLKDTPNIDEQSDLIIALNHMKKPFNPKEPCSGYVLDSLRAGLWSLESDSFEDGLTKVVNLGYDTDTNGAVAGALLGAKHGYKSIPKRWIDSIPREEFNEVTSLTKQLYQIAKANDQNYAEQYFKLMTS